jgi:hypothetical protein
VQVKLLDMETIAFRPQGAAEGISNVVTSSSSYHSLAASCIGGEDFRAPEVESAYNGGGGEEMGNWDAAAEVANKPASDVWSMGLVFLLVITEMRDLEQVRGADLGTWVLNP